jgi:hypothetical protein
MSNPNDQLNDEPMESSLDEPENEHEVKGQTGFKSFSITGGKIPARSNEVEGE